MAEAFRQAQSLLQDGDADGAERLLRRILATDPAQTSAASLLRQIEGDPVQLLGRESYAYVVRPGESLATIARDRLRDANLFYALARYNGIRVPRLLAAGQTIRVPGRAPAAPSPASSASPPPAAAPAPAPAPSPAPAAAAAPAPAAAPTPAPATQVPELMRAARVAVRQQDLCRGIALYDRVLAIEPGHTDARAERQKAADLAERLRRGGSRLEC